MKIYKNILVFIIVLFSLSVYSQNNTSYASFTDRLSWGGNLGASFGSYTYIQLAPVLYYSVTDDFVIGAGLDFTYYKDNRNPSFSTEGSVWSPRLFARYFIMEDIFVHAEYQQYYYIDHYSPIHNDWVWSEPSYYAGGGYRQWIGQNSYMFFMLLFDLQSSEMNFGTNPRIQMGFAAGF